MKSRFKRYELKYYIPEKFCSELINLISPYMVLDPYSESKGVDSYLVRSLYLDTDNLRFYYEKLSGIRDREKFRIRAYNDERSKIFLEIKRKNNNIVTKDRECIKYDDLHSILDRYGKDWTNNGKYKTGNGVIMRFLSFIISLQLRPMILIAYERRAYIGAFDNDIRLTIDCNICCLPGRSYDLFYSGRNWIYLDKPCILELKFNDMMPFFFKTVISRFNLRMQSISKYCLCIERSKSLLL